MVLTETGTRDWSVYRGIFHVGRKQCTNIMDMRRDELKILELPLSSQY